MSVKQIKPVRVGRDQQGRANGREHRRANVPETSPANAVRRQPELVPSDPFLVVGELVASALARERDSRDDAHGGHDLWEHDEHLVSDVVAFVHDAHNRRGPYKSVDARHHQQRGQRYSEFVAKFRRAKRLPARHRRAHPPLRPTRKYRVKLTNFTLLYRSTVLKSSVKMRL